MWAGNNTPTATAGLRPHRQVRKRPRGALCPRPVRSRSNWAQPWICLIPSPHSLLCTKAGTFSRERKVLLRSHLLHTGRGQNFGSIAARSSQKPREALTLPPTRMQEPRLRLSGLPTQALSHGLCSSHCTSGPGAQQAHQATQILTQGLVQGRRAQLRRVQPEL